MKKLLLSLSLLIAGATQAQNLLSQNFDVFPGVNAPGTSDQWVRSNQSTPLGLGAWSQGGGTAFAGGGQAGGATSFSLVNYTSTTGTGTISNWLFAPVMNLKNGDVITFYARQGGTAPSFADRMQLRIATDYSDFTVMPSTGATDVGDFATVAVDINPNLTQAGFPLAWTQYTYTMSGLTEDTEVPCRLGFRYFVTNGGPDGANSNIIAIDTFSVDRPLATESFFAANFAVSPNPATDVININSKNNIAVSQAQVTDLNGRVVKTVNGEVSQINVSELNAGVYFLKVTTAKGSGSTKVIKK